MMDGEKLLLDGKADEAFPLIQKEAEKGNGRAMYLLGRYYEKGFGSIMEDEDRAAMWYKKGEKAGDPLCQLAVARSMGQAERYAVMNSAFPKVMEMANGRDLAAMMELSEMYLKSGIMLSLDEGLSILMRAVMAGYWHAFRELAIIYRDGFFVNANPKKAFTCFAKAAEAGDPYSECALGEAYFDGIGTEMDREKGYSLLEKAAKDGSAEAAYRLALIYEEGRGLPQSYEKAFEYYKKAADMGHTLAKGGLAYCYEKGRGTKQNMDLAIKLYTEAGNEGDDDSLFRAAMLKLERGDKDAIDYIEQAAKNGSEEAAYIAGTLYIQGEKVPEDKEKGIEYLREAADAGYEKAAEALSHVYVG